MDLFKMNFMLQDLPYGSSPLDKSDPIIKSFIVALSADKRNWNN